MKYRHLFLCMFFFVAICQLNYAQENQGGRFSGDLVANGNFFIRDTAIGAANTPQYDHQLFGAETWLNLRYSNWGFDVGVRFDLFNNSNLLNPQGSYSAQGIGRWFIKKKINNLDIAVGYLYDQIGSGIIFRAFEQRPLLIDNALYGARLKYSFNEDWSIKAFTGKQKFNFSSYSPIIKGAAVDGYFASDEEAGTNWSLAPGLGIVNRTIDDETMRNIVSSITTYNIADSIGAHYNTYAFSAYNTLSVGKFSWYIEGAYKTQEQIFDPFAVRLAKDTTNSPSLGKMISVDGNVLYTTLSYASKGFGVTLEAKRTENFKLRVDPFVELNRGAINFLPPMARVNTYRLNARYNSATQELGELAFQADVSYAFSKKLLFNLNFSNITDLNNNLLYREIYAEGTYKYKRKWQLISGVQLQNYNQEVFEVKPKKGIVQTITPFAEFLYKFTRKKSLRMEAQYMFTGVEWGGTDFGEFKSDNRDLGDWVFLLAEFGIAPHWIFEVSDMYNIDPSTEGAKANHYPAVGIVYIHKSNRFSVRYVKQVEGVVCTGGICRLEPAFSGVKMSINSTF